MKRYRLSFAESAKHLPTHPERTAYRSGTGTDFDVYYQEWPSREAMLKSIQMQGRGPTRATHWRACQRA